MTPARWTWWRRLNLASLQECVEFFLTDSVSRPTPITYIHRSQLASPNPSENFLRGHSKVLRDLWWSQETVGCLSHSSSAPGPQFLGGHFASGVAVSVNVILHIIAGLIPSTHLPWRVARRRRYCSACSLPSLRTCMCRLRRSKPSTAWLWRLKPVNRACWS